MGDKKYYASLVLAVGVMAVVSMLFAAAGFPLGFTAPVALSVINTGQEINSVGQGFQVIESPSSAHSSNEDIHQLRMSLLIGTLSDQQVLTGISAEDRAEALTYLLNNPDQFTEYNLEEEYSILTHALINSLYAPEVHSRSSNSQAHQATWNALESNGFGPLDAIGLALTIARCASGDATACVALGIGIIDGIIDSFDNDDDNGMPQIDDTKRVHPGLNFVPSDFE